MRELHAYMRHMSEILDFPLKSSGTPTLRSLYDGERSLIKFCPDFYCKCFATRHVLEITFYPTSRISTTLRGRQICYSVILHI